MSWFDTLLAIGSTMDWISPAVQMIEDVGGMTCIRADIPPGWSGLEVRRTLEANGVRVGRTPMIVDGQMVMNVDDPDQAFAILEWL